jgi:hypothetical protein
MMPKDKSKASVKDNTAISTSKPRAKEHSESKWRSFLKFGRGNSDGKGVNEEHVQKGKAAAGPPQSSTSITKAAPSSSSTVPPSASKLNYSNPSKVTPGETQIEQTSHDNSPTLTTEVETVPEASIGESVVSPQLPDSTKSQTSAGKIESMTSITKDGETETQSASQGKTRQRRAAEESFKTAVEKLQHLMLQIAGKESSKLITTVISIDNFDDFDKNVNEIGSAIDNFIDNRTELRAQKGQIKEIAEKWYKACFPFVKGGLGIASVCILI